MYVVGLTGGIGSGKSTVAARLAAHGCAVVDADRIAREVVEPGEPALVEIEARFGPGILRDDGHLDRRALAAVVFDDPAARRDLERITHPRIAARIRERVADGARASDDPGAIVVIDHPLLVETGQAADFDAVLVVTAPEEVRVARLREQRGMDDDDARARIRAQTDDASRRAVTTHLIDNRGSVEELLAQVDRVHDALVRAAEAVPR